MGWWSGGWFEGLASGGATITGSGSTDESVRSVIVQAIQGIAVSELGFDDADSSVQEYLLEFEDLSQAVKYLSAMKNGKPVMRKWAVQVTSTDNWFATGDVVKRTYEIRAVGYYGFSAGGVNELVRATRKVRSAIRQLTSRLGGTVDTIDSVSNISPSRTRVSEVDQGGIISGGVLIVAKKTGPDF